MSQIRVIHAHIIDIVLVLPIYFRVACLGRCLSGKFIVAHTAYAYLKSVTRGSFKPFWFRVSRAGNKWDDFKGML